MKKVQLYTIPVIIGVLFMFACSRITPVTMAEGQPGVKYTTQETYAGLVLEKEKTVIQSSKEIPVDPSRQEAQAVSEPSNVMAMSPQEKERDFSGTMHHWMALLAMKNNDVNEASRHLQDAMAFINEPKHMAEMQKLMALIAKGKLYDTEHSLEEMAGGESISRVKVQRYHLQSAGKSIETRDLSGVKRHMEDFMAEATDKQKNTALELVQKAEKGDFSRAEYALVELIKR